MPTLPTITVTDAQATRILAAYQAKYGTTTQAETVAAYKKELAQHVIETVLNHEGHRIMRGQAATRHAEIEAIKAELPDPETVQ